MADQFELERRVKELEAENARLRGAGAGVRVRGVPYRSAFEIWNLPLVAIAAAGGAAIGSLALGGGAVGGVAIGGGAAGYYACGGGAAGAYTVSALRRDPEAVDFFARYGLGSFCGDPATRGRYTR